MESIEEGLDVLPPAHQKNPHAVPLLQNQDAAKRRDIDDGLYAGVDAASYLDNPRMSRTPLTEANRSAMHVEHRYKSEREATKSMNLGTAIHAAVLEPMHYENEYAISPQCCAETGSGSRCSGNASKRFTLPVEELPSKDAAPEEFETFPLNYEGDKREVTRRWYCDQYGHAAKFGKVDGRQIQHDRVEPISEDQAEKVERMREALYQHPDANKYLWDLDGVNEAVAFWTDPKFGVPMKSRYDRFIYEDDEDTVEVGQESEKQEVGRPVIVDLKSTRNASLEEFQRDIGNRRYHFQAATYVRGARSLGWPRPKWMFVCVENEEPFGVATYELKPETISTAENEVRSAMRVVAEAMDEDQWSGYPPYTRQIGKPRWA